MTGPAIRRLGKAEGTPLVLLHGFGGTMRTWNKVFPLLVNELPLILVDLPGHGESIESDGRGGAGKMAKAILAQLNGEGVDAFHLGGHSMGGAVSALIAMRAPEQVKSLTLVAPGGMASGINAGMLGIYAKASAPEQLREIVRQMAGPNVAFPEGYFEELSKLRAAPGAMDAIGATYQAMFPEGASEGQGVLPREMLQALPMPIAMIWGDADSVLPCPTSADVPVNFDFTVIAGAGHMLPEETPELVAEALRKAASKAP